MKVNQILLLLLAPFAQAVRCAELPDQVFVTAFQASIGADTADARPHLQVGWNFLGLRRYRL